LQNALLMICPTSAELIDSGLTHAQLLTWLHTLADDRLVREQLLLLDAGRTTDNWVGQPGATLPTPIDATFSMHYVCMVHDYALYRGNRTLLHKLIPGVRCVIERWRQQVDSEYLVHLPDYNSVTHDTHQPVHQHNYPEQNPISGDVCGMTQWQLIYTLMQAAHLEQMLNEPLLAQRHRQTAATLAAVGQRRFFNTHRGLFADNLDQTRFSQQAQIWAVLSGQLPDILVQRVSGSLMMSENNPPIADIQWVPEDLHHFLFEALGQLNRVDEILLRMSGLTLSNDQAVNTDGHYWYSRHILGIRPDKLGFAGVTIRPQPGLLAQAHGTMVHPNGIIKVNLTRQSTRQSSNHMPLDHTGPSTLHGDITLPPHTVGTLHVNDMSRRITGHVIF
jgi:alpha-L-rhamnosidase